MEPPGQPVAARQLVELAAGVVVLAAGPGLDLGGRTVLQPAVGVVDGHPVQVLDDVVDPGRRVRRPRRRSPGAGGGTDQREAGDERGEPSHAGILALRS